MRFILLALAVVGCGGDGGEPVTVRAANSKLAAVRAGDTWKPLEPNAAGDIEVDVDGPTQVMTVCDEPNFFTFYTIAFGPGAEPLDMACSPPPTNAVRVSVVAPSSVDVFIGFDRGEGGDTLVVGGGTYDVIAIDSTLTPPRFELRRDVALTADTTLTFDLANAGVAMTKVPVTVANVGPGETTRPIARVTTPNRTLAYWWASPTDVWVLPASATVDGVRHFVGASTSNETMGRRRASHTVQGNETSIALELPGYITAATVTLGREPSITWQADPQLDDVSFGIHDPGFERLWYSTVMPSYVDAGGDNSTVVIPDTSSVPGWSAAWSLPASTAGLAWTFSADHRTARGSVGASREGEL
ncbi:MAG TPA: hypothetical protein VK427_03590 [Kofleriaceae bacterium]|nr:hypothetical protein [Kofleriaceae bacterium]